MTIDQLQYIMPQASKGIIETYLPHLNIFMPKYGIDNTKRQAAFIAQLAHESGQFRYVRELASGKAYEGRKDLGNVHIGDGVKYKGRGLIQITGRSNYNLCSIALTGKSETLLDNPELLTAPCYAVESACWFWAVKLLNEYADKDNFESITKRINGGLAGYQDRIKYWEAAKKILLT